MNEITKKQYNLPSKLEDLTRFVLVGREKLNSVRAEIRAIDKLDLATEVKDQKRDEATMLAGALLDAEAKIGELLPEPKSIRNDLGQLKAEKTLPFGITKQQAGNFRTLADNQDIIEQVKAEAKENDDLPTRTEVLRRVKELGKEDAFRDKQNKYAKQGGEFQSKEIKIWHGEFQKLSEKIGDNSVDLILTDPPYPEEFLPLWKDMFDVADRILKPGKFLVCYANHQNLDKIFRLPNNLKYYWIFKLDFTLKPIAMGRNLIATWKPVLIYQKPPFKKIETTIEDSIKFAYTERELHDKNWGQTIQPFEWLLDNFSEPNDLVFEPFAGSGTTLLACLNKKRRCIGVEIEEKYINIIKGRLNELQRNNRGKE